MIKWFIKHSIWNQDTWRNSFRGNYLLWIHIVTYMTGPQWPFINATTDPLDHLRKPAILATKVLAIQRHRCLYLRGNCWGTGHRTDMVAIPGLCLTINTMLPRIFFLLNEDLFLDFVLENNCLLHSWFPGSLDACIQCCQASAFNHIPIWSAIEAIEDFNVYHAYKEVNNHFPRTIFYLCHLCHVCVTSLHAYFMDSVSFSSQGSTSWVIWMSLPLVQSSRGIP